MTIVTLLAFFSLNSWAMTESWNITEKVDTPESAYWDSKSKTLFVANVAGAPDKKDGKGWISKYEANGKVIQEKWVDGIDAPKGLRALKGTLWLSNIDEVRAYEISSGTLVTKIQINGAKFLNDIALHPDGRIFVSDTFGNKVFEIKNGKAKELKLKEGDFEGPNGLLISGGDLIVAAWGMPNPDWSTKVPGHLFKVNLRTGVKTLITATPLGNLDGLEKNKAGDFVVSDFQGGKIFQVSAGGEVKTLFEGLKTPADIGLLSDDKIVVPSMSTSRVFEISN